MPGDTALLRCPGNWTNLSHLATPLLEAGILVPL
jgi:hypothetical protein